jgi:hypothetical protein
MLKQNRPPIIWEADMIDAEWMTAVLEHAGVLPTGRVVQAVGKPIGNGLVNTSLHFSLRYQDGPKGLPKAVVAKFSAADIDNPHAFTRSIRKREINFYRLLAPRTSMFVPRAYFAEVEPDGRVFTLIAEDLTPARIPDQITGCSLDDVETAILEAAALHAPFWNAPDILEAEWLDPVHPMVAPSATRAAKIFKDRFSGTLDKDIISGVERLPAAVNALSVYHSGSQTVVHGDFRLDNVIYDVQGGARRMATVDWQTVARGSGPFDVAYFIGTALDAEARRENELELVRRYHAELVRLGVAGYEFDECWLDYRRGALTGVLIGVISARSVTPSERGDALFPTMVRRSCKQALDLGTFDLWGA